MQQIEMEHKQNEDMTIVVNDLRSLRHDMNNHMSVLQGLLAMQEYDDAKNYLSTITEELAVANSFICSIIKSVRPINLESPSIQSF